MINYSRAYLSYFNKMVYRKVAMKQGPTPRHYLSKRQTYLLLKNLYQTGFNLIYYQPNNNVDPFIPLDLYYPKVAHYFDTNDIKEKIPNYIYVNLSLGPVLYVRPTDDDYDFKHKTYKKVPMYLFPKQLNWDDFLRSIEFSLSNKLMCKFLKQYMPPFDPDECRFWCYDHEYNVAVSAINNDEIDYNPLLNIEEEEDEARVDYYVFQRYKMLSRKRFRPTDYEESAWGREDRKWEQIMQAKKRYDEAMDKQEDLEEYDFGFFDF